MAGQVQMPYLISPVSVGQQLRQLEGVRELLNIKEMFAPILSPFRVARESHRLFSTQRHGRYYCRKSRSSPALPREGEGWVSDPPQVQGRTWGPLSVSLPFWHWSPDSCKSSLKPVPCYHWFLWLWIGHYGAQNHVCSLGKQTFFNPALVPKDKGRVENPFW